MVARWLVLTLIYRVLPYLVITELGHVDALVVVATHPLQLAVTLQTRPSVLQSHPAVTATVADLHLKYPIIRLGWTGGLKPS